MTKVPGWDSEPRALFQRFRDGRNRVRVQLKDPVQLEGLHTLAVAQSGVEGVGWDARRVAVASGVRFLKDLTPLVDRFQAQMTRHGDPGLAAFMLASAVDQEAASMRPSGGRLSGTERQALNNLLTALRAWEGEELHHSSKQDIEAYVRATARDAGRL